MAHIIQSCPSCGTKNRIPMEKRGLRPKCGRCGRQLPAIPPGVIQLGDDNFRQVVNGTPLPVLVDFYSPTCGPCQALAPVIQQLADQYDGRALICKLDTSRHQRTAAEFGIRGVPTLLFFKNGQMVDQIVGAVPAQEIQGRLNRLLQAG